MGTLQKFKFLATQCAVIGSPSRSPTTSPSPVIHIRRRKTLRMLLGKATGGGSNGGAFQRRFLHHQQNHRNNDGDDSVNRRNISDAKPIAASNRSGVGVRSKLKDLFVSSPPTAGTEEDGTAEGLWNDGGRSCGEGVVAVRRGGGVRPLSATLRQRLLLRRAWRPVLVGIPEVSP